MRPSGNMYNYYDDEVNIDGFMRGGVGEDKGGLRFLFVYLNR